MLLKAVFVKCVCCPAQLCRVLSTEERLRLFHGLAGWLRFGDDVFDSLSKSDDVITQLDTLTATLQYVTRNSKLESNCALNYLALIDGFV